MNRNLSIRKCLTVGIIFLFVGTIVIPSAQSESLLPDFTTSIDEISLIGINAVSAKAPKNNGSWGFILSKEFIVTYVGAIDTSKSVDRWGGPFVEFTVIGIGKHIIQYTCNYSIYTYKTPQPYNGSFNGSDDLHLCNFYKEPSIKIKATESGIILSSLFKKGTWVGKLYIDGTLIETKQFNYERI
jgi:hypothetical protein